MYFGYQISVTSKYMENGKSYNITWSYIKHQSLYHRTIIVNQNSPNHEYKKETLYL